VGDSKYIHGTSGDEQARLSLLNDILNQACLEEINVLKGTRFLDVGSGLGQLTRAIRRVTGPELVVGIERDRRQLEEAKRKAQDAGDSGVEFREGDAADLPLRDTEWGTFDVAHARFLLEHVPDPAAVVRGMVRAVRPGGRIILMDDDHELLHLWPEPSSVMALWKAYCRAYTQLGNDPYVGRRLVELLQGAGALPTRNTMVFFGACAGDPSFEMIVDNFAGVLSGAQQATLPLLDAPRFEAAMDELRRWRAQPNAAYWYSVPFAEAIRPG
jgi:ubiquinone/menaquinone biosynthesis C-methylase UbiE